MKNSANKLFAKLDGFISVMKKREQKIEILKTRVNEHEARIAKLEAQNKTR